LIKPLLHRHHLEFVGELGGSEKDAFLGGADTLFFPICWPEPFGLVMIEALACGTPVLALDYGSVPEVLQDGLTGFIGQGEDDLVRAIPRLGALNRAGCRAEAERRFSPSAMVEAYEDVYANLIARRASEGIVRLDAPLQAGRVAVASRSGPKCAAGRQSVSSSGHTCSGP
jgi:glycosyltransferase involved in cell wall biosynthesis